MKLKSFLKKFFLGGEVLERVHSQVNGEITVAENLFGGKELRIGGVTQSGGLVEKLWRDGLKEIPRDKVTGKTGVLNALILGLGAGDVARLINERWPECKIVGVEIDPEVVSLGKKYFGLGKISNLEIFVADAIKFVDPKYKIHNTKYDLILVDLYLGKDYPKAAESKEFLQQLKNILSKNGLVVINRLYYTSSFQKEAESFLMKVKEVFSKVEIKKAVTNLLIFAN